MHGGGHNIPEREEKNGQREKKCMACEKKLTKLEYTLHGTQCGLRIHKNCPEVSDDLFMLNAEQQRPLACRTCTLYVQGMH
jgi:threonine synthase